MNFDHAAGRLSFDCTDAMIEHIEANELKLEWIIETHVHADHLSGAPYIQELLGGKIGIGEHIVTVQDTFGKVFDEGTDFQRNGSQFDALFADGDSYLNGRMTGFAVHTPGHTPACIVHVFGDATFAGDALFIPDGGSARVDFPGGDAGALYDFIQRVLSLPDEMRLFVCHDYGPGGRAIAWETTIGTQKEENIHVGGGTSRDDFIRMRTKRGAQLSMPALIIPALQVNIRAGSVPKDDDGNMSLKIPLNRLLKSGLHNCAARPVSSVRERSSAQKWPCGLLGTRRTGQARK